MSRVQLTSDLPKAAGLVHSLDLGDIKEWLVTLLIACGFLIQAAPVSANADPG
jgi:hypothetical protein